MSVVDLLLYTRTQFLDAKTRKDVETLQNIRLTIELFTEAAYHYNDKEAAGILEDIGASIRDSLMNEEWKSAVSTEERIRAVGETKKTLTNSARLQP